MGLDIWFREDITNALKAAEQASSTTAAAIESVVSDPSYLRAYRQGYKAALITIAMSFGIAGSEAEGAGPQSGDFVQPRIQQEIFI